MSSWTARAKAATTQTGQGGTAKTDETPVLGVLAVLAVPPPVVFEKPTDWHSGMRPIWRTTSTARPALPPGVVAGTVCAAKWGRRCGGRIRTADIGTVRMKWGGPALTSFCAENPVHYYLYLDTWQDMGFNTDLQFQCP